MKIQFCGENSFYVTGKSGSVVFDANEGFDQKASFATNSQSKEQKSLKEIKQLILPGEFEISGILIKGFYTNDQKNVVYKVIIDEISIAHFGEISEIPKEKLFTNLGENIDIAFINLSENFNEKKAKELIDKIEPRMVFIGGDNQFFPKIIEIAGAKIMEENPINVKKSELSDDRTEIRILNV
jgi:L-ascorbate metabolism protein UlaG (beta-lactamase superfamily)